MELLLGDCLELLPEIKDDSVDLLFCDLPYRQTSLAWDVAIDLEKFWKEINRVCKIDTPMLFTCSVKFGNTLINSNPKNFRYDLIWVKSAACGFLNSKKQPMRLHEMVYVFYRKLPKVYTENISLNHTHKFIKETENKRNVKDGVDNKWCYANRSKTETQSKYDPALPNSVIKENKDEEFCKYDVNKNCYGGGQEGRIKISKDKRDHQQKYNPPLPNSLLECKSEKGKHSTQKPVSLMEWILKYYSREGGLVLDPTMGSASMGVACKNMKRQFIGIEKDDKIFEVAMERLHI